MIGRSSEFRERYGAGRTEQQARVINTDFGLTGAHNRAIDASLMRKSTEPSA
jgi:hypothetical protein